MTNTYRTTPVTIRTEHVGSHVGTIGVVLRRGRVIHRTDPRPYGFTRAAQGDAIDWANAHGYLDITDHDTEKAL